MDTNNETMNQQNEGPILNMEELKENNNQEVVNSPMQTNENNKPKGKKWLWGVGGIVALLLVGAAVFFFVLPGLSNEAKFVNLLLNQREVEGIVKKGEKLLKESEEIQMEVSTDIVDAIISNMNGEDAPKLGTIKMKNTLIDKEDRVKNDLEINIGDKDLIELSIIKDNNMIGTRVKDLIEDYIVIRNEDLKKLAEKFGADSSEMPDKIITNEEIEKAMTLKKSDIDRIAAKYSKVMINSIKGKVTKESNVEIKIDGQKYNTTKYTLELNQERYFKCILDIFYELKNDRKNVELIVENMNSLEKLYEENGYPEDMFGDLDVDEIMEELEETYDNLKETYDNFIEDYKEDEDYQAIKISVYEFRNKCIMTEINSDGATIYFKVKEGKEKDIMEVELENEAQDVSVKIVACFNWDKNVCQSDLKAAVKQKNMKIDIDILEAKTTYINKTEKEIEKLDDEFIINDATEDEIKEKLDEITNNTQNFMNKIMPIFEPFMTKSTPRESGLSVDPLNVIDTNPDTGGFLGEKPNLAKFNAFWTNVSGLQDQVITEYWEVYYGEYLLDSNNTEEEAKAKALAKITGTEEAVYDENAKKVDGSERAYRIKPGKYQTGLDEKYTFSITEDTRTVFCNEGYEYNGKIYLTEHITK